ncbi:MAG: ABC transporter permease [Clostridiales bacterium]|nr:ABC transporter permease [Clostridiales bacterium]HBM81597.1 taurine ABC transporter permease [Clostridiaceae bacterium]
MTKELIGEIIKIDVEKGKRENKSINNVPYKRVLSIVSPLILLLVWEVLVRIHVLDSRFFPAPTRILMAMWEMIKSGILFSDLKISLTRIFGGFLIGAVPGLIIGLTMGLFPAVKVILDPVIAATYPIPKLALMPLIMIIFGLTEIEKMVVIALGTFFLVLINTVAGVVNLDTIYWDVAKNYGASKKDYYLTVALPGALPMIFTGIKLGMGTALMLIVASEMNGATQGVGYRIWESYSIFNIPEMYVSFIVMSLLGYIFTVVLDELERVIIPWKHD